MKNFGKKRIILITAALLILFACIGMTAVLLFSNYRNVALFKEAQSNFQRGDDKSLDVAEAQLLQLIRNDDDNENAYIMLAAIAGKRKVYPEQVYYSFMAHKLNPLSAANKAEYIKSLLYAREFERLENFLSHQTDLSGKDKQILLYAAGRNGNIKKYPTQLDRRSDDNKTGELALLLFEHKHLSVQEKLSALELHFKSNDLFLQQEVLAAQAELYLESGRIGDAGKALQDACKLNGFAFAPALGRFYANFRTFGQALEVFEKYLKTYHDQAVAMQTAEIYCLLKKIDKIAELRQQYQADSGSSGMLCCYYFDALTALAKNDMAALQEVTAPLRKNIHTPLSTFMFLCVDVQSEDWAAIRQSYTDLLAHRKYLDLQSRADDMVENLLKSSLSKSAKNMEQQLELAKMLYRRKPTAFTAKFILLASRSGKTFDRALLQDALKKFTNDPGIIKIAIEYNLNRDLEAAKSLIAQYKKLFPAKAQDTFRYETVLALKNQDFEKASQLFQANYTPATAPEYWRFASSTLREADLIFLSKNKEYTTYCQALLLLKKGEKAAACDLLEKAPGSGNWELLFFAAKTLAENGRNSAALKIYSIFPENTPYRLAVLLNKAEIYAENNNMSMALESSRRAYSIAPDLPETQYCYADKLALSNRHELIPDVVKLTQDSPYRRRLKTLWTNGMQKKITSGNIDQEREKVRELCRKLLVIDPANKVAAEYLKKLNKMPQ